MSVLYLVSKMRARMAASLQDGVILSFRSVTLGRPTDRSQLAQPLHPHPPLSVPPGGQQQYRSVRSNTQSMAEGYYRLHVSDLYSNGGKWSAIVVGFMYLLLQAAIGLMHTCGLYMTFWTPTTVKPRNCAFFTALRVVTAIGLDSLLLEFAQVSFLLSGWVQLYQRVAK
jgi:hypothetical protein